MITVKLQKNEADAVERILDLILTNENFSKAIFFDGSERRDVLRVSKKIHWAKEKKCKAA